MLPSKVMRRRQHAHPLGEARPRQLCVVVFFKVSSLAVRSCLRSVSFQRFLRNRFFFASAPFAYRYISKQTRAKGRSALGHFLQQLAFNENVRVSASLIKQFVLRRALLLLPPGDGSCPSNIVGFLQLFLCARSRSTQRRPLPRRHVHHLDVTSKKKRHVYVATNSSGRFRRQSHR